MAEAFKRFLPSVTDIAARTMTYSGLDKLKARVAEGDLVIERESQVLTSEMVPAFAEAPLGALFITGSLRAPNATITEPDIDWSPLLKIKGNVVARNLCLGGRPGDRRRRDAHRRSRGLLQSGPDAHSRQDARAGV